MTHLYYTGIGSRETPDDVQYIMTEIAECLEKRGWVLRSGGADGADLAFEKGAGENKHIFLPWDGFNNSTSLLFNIPPKAFEIAEKIHPSWGNLSQGSKKLHARNVLQVTGKFLNVKSKFLVCWTKNGQCKGGTATALKLADMLGIRVFNLYRDDPMEVINYAKQFER